MNDEQALLAAIIAHPGEDTPRLAYADWLDENDAPIQADFIRTQCRLATCAADDPDYPDLVERHAELVAQFGPIARMTVLPKPPAGIVFDNELRPESDTFRRGFLYTVHGEWDDNQMSPEDGEIEQFCAGLPELIATTTARGLWLTYLSGEQCARVLAAPEAEAITGLSVIPFEWGGEEDAIARAIATAKCAPVLERLSLYMATSAAAVAPLARAKFGRLTHLELPMLSGPARDLRPLLEAKWFSALRSVRAGASSSAVESALLGALAKLPHLEALDLRFQFAALKALGSAGGFRSLAKLAVWFNLSIEGVTQMAKGAFPRLAELDLSSVGGPHLLALLKARWFPQLRVLSLRSGTLSEKAVVALSKSPAAANLRILRLEDITMGTGALAVLGNGARFPNLTTLELTTWRMRKRKIAEMAAFAKALALPRLRHLSLSGYPLGEVGAKALAANPALANLTRLVVRGCGIGEPGLTAIARSPHLQQLIELDVEANKLKTAAALRDPQRLPRLAAARLDGNPLTLAARRRLHAARGLVV